MTQPDPSGVGREVEQLLADAAAALEAMPSDELVLLSSVLWAQIRRWDVRSSILVEMALERIGDPHKQMAPRPAANRIHLALTGS